MKSYSFRLSCLAVLLSVLMLTGCGKLFSTPVSVQEPASTPGTDSGPDSDAYPHTDL